MIERPTNSNVWLYSEVEDSYGCPVGLKFRRRQTTVFYRVLFTGNHKICRDWARMGQDKFFTRHAKPENRYEYTERRAA